MSDARQGLTFTHEASFAQWPFGIGYRRAHNLDREIALEHRIAGAVDLTHGAAAQQLADHVATEARSAFDGIR